jgi:hypothetical protein
MDAFNLKAFTFAVCATVVSVGSCVVMAAQVQHLQAETARQCLERDWPKELNRAHEDFCVMYGYAMNQ